MSRSELPDQPKAPTLRRLDARPRLPKAHTLRPLADLVDLDRETKDPVHGEQLKAIGSERLRELVVMASNLLPLTDARVANQIARARWSRPGEGGVR